MKADARGGGDIGDVWGYVHTRGLGIVNPILQIRKLKLRAAKRWPSSYNMPRLASGSPVSKSAFSVLAP